MVHLVQPQDNILVVVVAVATHLGGPAVFVQAVQVAAVQVHLLAVQQLLVQPIPVAVAEAVALRHLVPLAVPVLF
jgi:hypothetical protein